MSYCSWRGNEGAGRCRGGGEEWVDWRGCGLSGRFYDRPFIWLGIIVGDTRGRAFDSYRSVTQLHPNKSGVHTTHPAFCVNMISKSLEHECSRVNHSYDGV